MCGAFVAPYQHKSTWIVKNVMPQERETNTVTEL